jgi:hypothetical protein
MHASHRIRSRTFHESSRWVRPILGEWRLTDQYFAWVAIALIVRAKRLTLADSQSSALLAQLAV